MFSQRDAEFLFRLRRSLYPSGQFSDAITAFDHKIGLVRALPVTQYWYGNPGRIRPEERAEALKPGCSKLPSDLLCLPYSAVSRTQDILRVDILVQERKGRDQEWVGTAEPADITGCTNSIAVATNSSGGGRLGVSTHCFTAPYIAQLAVAAIISWEMRRSSSG